MGNVAAQEETTDDKLRERAVFAIPGVVCVAGPGPTGGRMVHVGPAAGWMKPVGIAQWSREVSVVARAEISEAVCHELRLLLPENRILAIKYPRTHRAAKASPLLAVSADVGKSLVERGIRVFTIGFDRITGGLYLFAEGGDKDPVSLQGDLFQAIAPSLETGDSHQDIDACLDGLIDRLLFEKSDGVLSEVAVELAAELPRLAPAGAEMIELGAFEAYLESNERSQAKFEEAAKLMVSSLGKGALRGQQKVTIPLFGEALRDKQSVIALQMNTGNGKTTFLQLPFRERWLVRGDVREDVSVPAQEHAAEKKAADEKAAAEKAAEEKRIAEKKAADEKAAAEKRAAEARAAAEKRAAQKKAAEERAAAQKKAAEERAAAEKKAAEQRAAAEKKAAEQRAAAEKKAEEQRAAAEKRATDKAAEERAAAEKRASIQKAAEQLAAAEKRAAEKRAEEKHAAEKRTAEERAAAKKRAAEKKAENEKAAAKKRIQKGKGQKTKAPKTQSKAKAKSVEKKASDAPAEDLRSSPPESDVPPIPPVSQNTKSMYVGIAAVLVVLSLVAIWALFLRN